MQMEGLSIFFCVLFVSGVSGVCNTHLNITAPEKVTTLVGSCVRIPCTYEPVPADTNLANDTVFGVWIKNSPQFVQNPQNIIFNSSGESVYKGIIGELRDRNCTTVFKNFQTNQTDRYYFRIERAPFKATDVCRDVSIEVLESPPSPTFKISSSLPQLREAKSVTLTCSAPTYCLDSPPQLTWTLQGHDTPDQVQEHNETLMTFMTTIQTTFYLTDKDDGLNITCSARYLVNNGREKLAEENVILNVSYAPKDTSVSVSPTDGLSAGNQVNLSCSSRANPASQFVWLKRNPDGTKTEIAGRDLYDITLAEGEVYICLAFNDLGNQTSARIRVTGWTVIIGAVFGFVVPVVLIVVISVWCLKKKAQTQNEDREELSGSQFSAQTDENNIHYGEINLSNLKPNNSSSSHTNLDRGKQEDTVYSEVKVTTKAEN